MTKELLKLELKELDKKCTLDKNKVIIKYIIANNPYKIGDNFTDHIGTINIEKIEYTGGDSPGCIYYGIELKKDGTPNKRMNRRYAYQCNDTKEDIPSQQN